MFIAGQIFKVLAMTQFNSSKVVFFGTNLNRIFFIFFIFSKKRAFFVYNEMPELNKRNPIYYIDKFVFLFFKSNVYLSNFSRAEHVKLMYSLPNMPGILENYSAYDLCGYNPKCFSQRGSSIFVGSVSSKRFGEEFLAKFKKLSLILGSKATAYALNDFEVSREFSDFIDFKSPIEHSKVLQVLEEYKFGILTYYTGDVNYDLCAPLKIYEYVYAGCVLISLNKNRSLVSLAELYPNLILFLDDITDGELIVDEKLYASDRERFLKSGIDSNINFANRVIGVE